MKKLMTALLNLVVVFSAHTAFADDASTYVPENPGSAPLNTCLPEDNACQSLYQDQYDAWKTKKDAYDMYVAAQSGGSTNGGISDQQSVADSMAAATEKLLKKADRLQFWSVALKVMGAASIALGIAALFGTFGMGASAAYALIALGTALIGFGASTKNKADQTRADAQMTCDRFNQVSTQKYDCAALTAQAIKLAGSTQTISSVTDLIDPSTGLCKAGTPTLCQEIVKKAPAGCFKEGAACMASLTGKKPTVKLNKDGTVTAKLNGKERTFGEGTFDSEKNMIAAGFTPAQAKQFIQGSGQSEVKKKVKELDQQVQNDLSALMASFGSSSGSTSATSAASKGKYTETPGLKPAAVENTERAPSSADTEAQAKVFNGENIGSHSNDIFKMVKDRYKVKESQDSFYEK